MPIALEHRSFGCTGEKVSVIGLGGAGLYKHSYEQGVATVKHALDMGVTYFDTSPAYGKAGADGRWVERGKSQLIMGEGLDGATKPHLLATKLVSYTNLGGANPMGYRTLEDCRTQLQDSLNALRRDKIDVLQGHDMEKAKAWSPNALNDDELLDLDREYDYESSAIIQALREAKAQGLCDYIGLSFNQSMALAHVFRRVKLDMCLSASQYSLLDRRSPQFVEALVDEQGIAYVIGGIFRGLAVSDEPSPFRLSIKGPLSQTGAIFSDERLIKLAKTTGISIAALTVRFLIANSKLSTILVGASSPEEIEESVLAAQSGPLPPDIHQTIEALRQVDGST